MARTIIIDRDRGFRSLLRRTSPARVGRRVITVGVHSGEGGAATESGATVADVATVHEFGLGVPERSFVRAWFDENRAKNQRALKLFTASALRSKQPIEIALEKAGTFYAASMQGRIQGGIGPPLEQSTIDRKGSSKPLIDTGQLVGSITHKVT